MKFLVNQFRLQMTNNGRNIMVEVRMYKVIVNSLCGDFPGDSKSLGDNAKCKVVCVDRGQDGGGCTVTEGVSLPSLRRPTSRRDPTGVWDGVTEV